MAKEKTININQNKLSLDSLIKATKYDFIDHLARVVVNTTCSEVVFREKELENGEKVPFYWADFVEDIKEHNKLERLIKSDIKFKSIYGRNILGFDIFKGKPLFWFAEEGSEFNECMRINDQIPFAVKVQRSYANSKNEQVLLRNQIVYTENDTYTLYMGGLAAKLKEKFKNTFPWANGASLQIPEYIRQNVRNGKHTHNFGTIPAMEFLNRELIDNVNDYDTLSDWYPAKDTMLLIEKTIEHFAWETELNHTRVFGSVSQQEFQAIKSKNNATSLAQQNMYSRGFLNNYMEEAGSDQHIINKKLILKAFSGENPLSVMNSTLNINDLTSGLKALIALAFQKAGYSMNLEDNSVYENVSQTQDKNKGVYETTKEKIKLFTSNWKELFCKVAFVLFNKVYGISKTMRDIKKEFDLFVDFKIISNVLQEQNNDWRKIMELRQNKIVSNLFAIRKIFPELSETEAIKMNNELEESESLEMNNINNSPFENQDQFGSDNDKDNTDTALKGKEENE